jgi:hypothetical protein
MRPGTIWFIKDLSEQNLHSARDILERPALVQLCKVSVRAIMHGLVVACGIGSIEGLMRLGRCNLALFTGNPDTFPCFLPHDIVVIVNRYPTSAGHQSRFGSISVLGFVSCHICLANAIRKKSTNSPL